MVESQNNDIPKKIKPNQRDDFEDEVSTYFFWLTILGIFVVIAILLGFEICLAIVLSLNRFMIGEILVLIFLGYLISMVKRMWRHQKDMEKTLAELVLLDRAGRFIDPKTEGEKVPTEIEQGNEVSKPSEDSHAEEQ